MEKIELIVLILLIILLIADVVWMFVSSFTSSSQIIKKITNSSDRGKEVLMESGMVGWVDGNYVVGDKVTMYEVFSGWKTLPDTDSDKFSDILILGRINKADNISTHSTKLLIQVILFVILMFAIFFYEKIAEFIE